jgi:hypothetical protein
VAVSLNSDAGFTAAVIGERVPCWWLERRVLLAAATKGATTEAPANARNSFFNLLLRVASNVLQFPLGKWAAWRPVARP